MILALGDLNTLALLAIYRLYGLGDLRHSSGLLTMCVKLEEFFLFCINYGFINFILVLKLYSAYH
jgi:hypothetical protein